MSVPYASVAEKIAPTRAQYNDASLDTTYSLPVETVHFGYPNVFTLPYRKSHTAGFLEGGLLEFPEKVFPRNNKMNSDMIINEVRYVRGFDQSYV